MNFTGLIFAMVAVLFIGLGFVWVIKLEYYIGAHISKIILIFGSILMICSLFIENFWGSSILGLVAGTIIWGSFELPDQELRAKAGQFPINPNRKKRAQ